MAAKTLPANNIIEQAERIASDAWEQTGKIAKDTAKTVAADVSSQVSFYAWLGLEEPRSEEELKAKEDEELMWELDGFKQKMREIDNILGRTTNESELDEKVRKFIEERKKELSRGLSELRQEHKEQAGTLGEPPQGEQQKKQAEDQKKAEEERENEEKRAEEQASLENVPETQSKVTGLNPKFKRMRNPWKAAPRSTEKLKRAASKIGSGAESRAGRGVGG